LKIPSELVAIALILAAAAGSGIAVTFAGAGSNQGAALPTLAPPTPVRSATPVPAILPGPLDGLPTARALALRRPMAVVIDNFYPDARPQSGLSRASVVFETLVESGITRLMPVFLEHDSSNVGPIRSARPYFVQWAAGFGALFVHDGGSPASLSMLKRVTTLGDVEAQSPAQEFHREAARIAPHDLFTSTRGVVAVARRAGTSVQGSVSWLRHKPFAPAAARGPGRTPSIDFSTPSVQSASTYRVSYRFDRTTDLYTRFVGDAPALDAGDGKPITVANVAVLTTSIKPIPSDPLLRITIRTIGSGPATILQDGRIIHGSWSKTNASAALRLVTNGHTVRLNPGSTWVEVVPRGALRFET
jgi:hypothetical protein